MTTGSFRHILSSWRNKKHIINAYMKLNNE
jgi:hypothetical protein